MGHSAYEHMESTGGAGAGGNASYGGPGGGGGMHVDPEDLFREFFGGGRGAGPAAGGGGPGGGGDFQSTIFEQMFGGAAGFGGRPRRGHTLQTTMAISFEESVKGSSKIINLNTGKQVEVAIPAGIQHGQQIRIQGHGAPGPKGTPPGDLLVQIMVMPSRQGFIRDGYDIHYEVPVSMVDAALGTEVDVPTINGNKVVAVKPGTQPHHKMRMRGHGVPMDVEGPLGRGRRGDQWIRVRVEVPRNLNDRQKQLLKEFKEAANNSSSSSGGGGGGTAKEEEESSSEPKEEEKKKKRGWFG
jgi:molecular chaperone DnaJ